MLYILPHDFIYPGVQNLSTLDIMIHNVFHFSDVNRNNNFHEI